jgi:hypothetical protein
MIYDELSIDNGRENRRKLLYNRDDHIFNFVNLFDTGNNIMLTTFYLGNFHWIIYDKNYKTCTSYNKIENDLDGSLIGQRDYWPRAFNNNGIYFILPFEDVQHDIKYGNILENTNYSKILDSGINGDGILAICKFK